MREAASDFTATGKRFRAQFAYWGWRSAASADEAAALSETPNTNAGSAQIVSLGSALEMFHAAALVHDDIIDRSDSRRGRASVHRQFEQLHRSHGWRRDAALFGEAAAILLGDLLLMWSDELLSQCVSTRAPVVGRRVRDEFNRMRTQVTAGQYLDLVSEVITAEQTAEALQRAERVITYKSAKYSVEAPLALGALLAEADAAHISTLRDYGLPLGLAYQLRDDLLGVFGDPDQTGKPSGDDLREGKRTVLVALARQRSGSTAKALLDEHLGDPTMTDATLRLVQEAVADSGAVEAVEARIAARTEQSRFALGELTVDDVVRQRLEELATAVTQRSA